MGSPIYDSMLGQTKAYQRQNRTGVEVQRTNTHLNNIILLIIIVFRIRGIGGNSADRFGRKGRKSSSQLKRK